jgi:hypothetical protein
METMEYRLVLMLELDLSAFYVDCGLGKVW